MRGLDEYLTTDPRDAFRCAYCDSESCGPCEGCSRPWCECECFPPDVCQECNGEGRADVYSEAINCPACGGTGEAK